MLLGEAGSIPALGLLMVYQTYDFIWVLSSIGRASALHAEGQGFDSPSIHHIAVTNKIS